MSKDELPITPLPRPVDPFTAQDATRLYTMIDSGLKKIQTTLEEFSNRIAIMQKQDIETLNILKLIEAESSNSRLKRLELEIEEAERERDIALQNVMAIETKLAQKQNIKDQSADTGEKMKAAAAAVISDSERKKQEAAEAFLLDLRRSILKAVLTTLAVGTVTGTIAFVWWLFQLYVNRGSP